MSNWGGQSNEAGSSAAWFERYRPAFLIITTAALIALGAAFIFTDRYAVGQAGGLPVRLDKFTGEIIACVPPRGCFAIVPAGQPPLATMTAAPAPKSPTGAMPTPAPAPAPPSK